MLQCRVRFEFEFEFRFFTTIYVQTYRSCWFGCASLRFMTNCCIPLTVSSSNFFFFGSMKIVLEFCFNVYLAAVFVFESLFYELMNERTSKQTNKRTHERMNKRPNHPIAGTQIPSRISNECCLIGLICFWRMRSTPKRNVSIAWRIHTYIHAYVHKIMYGM